MYQKKSVSALSVPIVSSWLADRCTIALAVEDHCATIVQRLTGGDAPTVILPMHI